MSSLSRELVFLILQFLDEEKFKDSVHKLEQESGFFFNMRYFEDMVTNGEWEEVEKYLSGFTKVDDNRYSMKIFFEIRKQKYLEALDKRDRAKAVDILVKDLKVFAAFNEELFKEITQLLTLENFRDNEQLSKYGDTKSARSIMLAELKKLIEANPLFRDKLQFPTLKNSRLRTLINQSLNWQHQLCKNPRSNPDIKTLFVDHSCGQPNGTRAPSPVTNHLMGAVPKTGGFPPLGAHGPFQPTPAALPTSLAGWMANPSPVPHPSASAGPLGLAAANTAAILKRPRTPPTGNPTMDYQTADSEHILKRSRPFGITDEANNLPVNMLPVAYPNQSHGQSSYSSDDLPRSVVMTLSPGSTVKSMDFHPVQQILLLVGTNTGDVMIYKLPSQEKIDIKNFKVWDLGACSGALQASLASDYTASINRVMWSPDGTLFGVAYSKHIVHIYSYHGVDELRNHLEIDAHVGSVNDLAFSYPNKQLCVVTCGDDRLIKVWDATTGNKQYTFEGHEAPVYSVCPHHKENIQFIFSTATDGKIKAWLYDNVGSRVDYDAPGHSSTTMAYSADGARLFSCGTNKEGDSYLVEWNESEGAVKRTYHGLAKRTVGVVQFDTTKNRFLAAGDEFTVKFWDMDNVNLLTSTDADGGLPASPTIRFNYELVYQVRTTKEIFRDYGEYLNRINLYRQRIWMCKVSGKTNLTYEEALLSEERATEKVQQFPKELVAPALQIIQYSMLSLKDLADIIATKLQDHIYVGAEMYGRKGDDMYPCKISKVFEESVGKVEYEVAWLDRNKEVMETSVINREDLRQKKPPFSRNFLKSFIRESTYRNAPWVLHGKLAQIHGISTSVPENLRGKVSFKDGLLVCKKRRKNEEEAKHERQNFKRKKVEGSAIEEGDEPAEEPIKYPIDDLLVQPDADDPVFTDRPSPLTDFNVPMECVGDLLMVWDFCSSFGRLLHLWPFSLEDFENAICHKMGNLILLVETHSALLRLLMKDNDEYSSTIRKRNRKLKITLITWTEYLCDFLDMVNSSELRGYIATIKRGHYGILDAHAKLLILRELVSHALETNTLREKLAKFVEQRQALGATIRGEALEEARKKREEKDRLKAEYDPNQVVDLESNGSASTNGNHMRQNGDIVKKRNGEIQTSRQNCASEKSESNQIDNAPKKTARKQNLEVDIPIPNGKGLSEKDPHERSRDDRKEVTGMKSKEQRKEYYEREIEKRVIRTNSLGKDRNYNRYWWFQRDGRIFVESSDSKQWGYYSSKEELYLLIGSLNCKGERERALKKQLEKFNSRICLEMEKRSRDLVQEVALEEAVLRRSSRVRAPPKKNPANAFLEYVNKWKED